MLSPRLTNCPECSNIPSLLKKIDCKLAELGNNLYNNISYMLNKPIPAGDITQLIAYRRILTHKYCNPNYLHKYSVAMIASRVIRLTAGCVSRCNTLEPCLEIPCDITIVPNPTTTSTSTISPTTTTTSSSSTSTTTSTTIAPTTTTTTTVFNFNLPQFVNSINSCYEQVTSLIPNIVYFSDNTNPDGPYTSIDDGCNDMYDGGNLFNTNLTQLYADISGDNVNHTLSIPYTHSQNTDDLIQCNYSTTSMDGYISSGTDYFGAGSEYLTNMYPGMFILVANNIDVTEFSITGNLGSDGNGTDTVYIATSHPGWTAFIKTNVDNDLSDPSVNHIILIYGDVSGATQLYDNTGEYDDHCIQGLTSNNSTIITIVVATEFNTPALTEEQALNIANKVLDVYNNVECITEQTIEITFDDIANADILVAGDANNVTDWNTFFDLPTYGTPFTSVSISGNIVSLIGATDITIKTELFYYNNGSESSVLEIVDISGVITTLEIGAFLDCYGLSYVVLNGVITAQDGVFNSCSGINFLRLPLLETAGDFCFYNVFNLTTINLPQLTTVGNQCFYNCTSLTTVILPQLITTGDYCFYNCIGLITIDLSSCTNLGGTVGDDNVFLNISGNTITLTIPTALMTCNSGSPDGDIQYLQAYNTVTIITT